MHAPITVSRRRRGFTIVELLISILIIGILAVVAAPKFSGMLHRYQADSAAQRIKADLEMARQHALSSSATLTVQFVPDLDRYKIPGLDDIDHSEQPYAIDLSESPYNADLLSASLGDDSNVQFDRFGRPDSGGTITVQSGSHQQTVTIDSETGKAVIP